MAKARPGLAPHGSASIVLADIPERNALRHIQSTLAHRRDAIAELDLEIETLRSALADFEALYKARLHQEHAQLGRIARLVKHLERWSEMLREQPRENVKSHGKRLERRRQEELREQKRHQRRTRRSKATPKPEPAPPETPPEQEERLKSAYRALARRFHPDLARTEEERVQFAQLMTRINALYRAQDLDRLLALEQQSSCGEIEDELDVDEQLEILSERLAWFDAVLQNLREERVDLERCATCELMRNVDQAAATGRDLLEELREELQGRVEHSYADVCHAIHALEKEMVRYNKRDPDSWLEVRESGTALEQIFDPYADKSVIRLGLDELASLSTSPRARQLATYFEDLVTSNPGLLRLVLFTYVSELSPFPLAGLENYDSLRLRFELLSDEDGEEASIEKSLVEGDELLVFGVRRATERVTHAGLRFLADSMREAVPLALRSLPVRRAFRSVLGVLGELERCPVCQDEVFAVPLFYLRGLDDLRASICPKCGKTLRRYWMPKGKDLQAVLNSAFLDFELVIEWSLQLSRATIAMQLLPMQAEAMRVADLKKRLHTDVFERYNIELKRGQIHLYQNNRRVSERKSLTTLSDRRLMVRLAADAPVGEGEALEMLRHRIRNRFRAN